MPSLRQKPDGRFYIDYTLAGRRARVAITAPDGAGAQTAIRDSDAAHAYYRHFLSHAWPRLLARAAQTQAAPDVQTSKHADPRLRDIAAHYTDIYLPAKNAADKTISKAAQDLAQFNEFAAAHHVGRASQLTPGLIDEYTIHLRALSLHAKTIRAKIGAIRACINAALDRDLLHQSPIRKWITPRVPEPEIQPLTRAQLNEVLEIVAANIPHYGPIVTWIALTGNRPSDATGLLWRQVDLERGLVFRLQTKTKRLARYQISAPALGILRQQQNAQSKSRPGAHVFQLDGIPISVHRLYHAFTRTLAAANFPRHVCLKDLRHTFASLLANDPEHPCPLTELQVLMGHTALKTTAQYLHPTGAQLYLDHYAKNLAAGPEP